MCDIKYVIEYQTTAGNTVQWYETYEDKGVYDTYDEAARVVERIREQGYNRKRTFYISSLTTYSNTEGVFSAVEQPPVEDDDEDTENEF